MKKMNRAIALFLALVLMMGAIVGTLTSCGDDETACEKCVDSDKDGKCDNCGKKVESNNPGTQPAPGEKVNYTVSVKTIGGMALEGVVITVFADNIPYLIMELANTWNFSAVSLT